jgi:hypothetical protein
MDLIAVCNILLELLFMCCIGKGLVNFVQFIIRSAVSICSMFVSAVNERWEQSDIQNTKNYI